jgi:peptidoglycan/xylan/chitin deacetylase (PgdA/CDA1 family)
MRLLAVNYHYYRPEKAGSGIVPITPARFVEQISQLAQTWAIASEAQVLQELSRGSGDAHLCLITFDDGLREQMQAIHWLCDRHFSAVCYVPTAPLVERRVLDVHKLHIIRTLKSDATLAASLVRTFGNAFIGMDRDAAARQYPYDDAIATQVKYFINFVLHKDERRMWADALFREIAGDEAAAAEALYMDGEDLRLLARKGMLGTHSHGHAPLSILGEDSARDEIGRSLDIIQEVTGVRVRGISYPYGGPTAVDETVARVAAAFGLDYGLTMRSGVNGEVELARPMLLARIDTNEVSTFLDHNVSDA